MSANAEQRAEILFYEAFELLRSERAGFLDEACGTDQCLRTEVEELLRSHDGAADFLPEAAPASPALETEFGRAKPEQAGEWIGNYKLLEQIGEGGFGTVWVAEQEKPVRRRVALKIIKPGMDTKEVIARFEQERQALAMMDHSNIARVLDAGATPLGRPYFVMELVRGIKITKYCDQANLPTAERLKLFIAVCHAVQHAHQKGIIHRDLKPSNILVTLHDGVPVPKVIDFGVGKATQQQRLTDLTVYTQFEQMVGTPLYMSPEQAEMSGLDIDTRSDIYSLGVLLYELLAGRTPFDPETLMKRGLDEIRRVVREQEPQKPSTFISTMALELRTNVAQQRQTDGAKLIGQIRGDLDWIVMKALEKDRTRRYETATGLAQDIQRHLTSEPVQARPASQLYRFRRFAKRNRIAFAAGSAVLAALIVGLGISTWMFFKEKQARERAVAAEQEQSRLRGLAVAAEKSQREERQRAETEAAKSSQVARFLKEMLEGAGPEVAKGRDSALLREILDRTAERLGSDLREQPEVEAELRLVIGSVYSDLGYLEEAAEAMRIAFELRRKISGLEHPSVAEAMAKLAVALQHIERTEEAVKLGREALAIMQRLLPEGDPAIAEAKQALAVILTSTNPKEAEVLASEALLMLEQQPSGAPDNLKPDSLFTLGELRVLAGRLPEAEALLREALTMFRRQYGNDHPAVGASLHRLSLCLAAQNKLPEAETVIREALSSMRPVLGDDHYGLAFLRQTFADVLMRQNKFSEAESVVAETVVQLGGGKMYEDALSQLGETRSRQEKHAEAAAAFREVIASRQKRSAPPDSGLFLARGKLARALTESAWIDIPGRDKTKGFAAVAPNQVPPRERAREAEILLRECLEFWQHSAEKDASWRDDDVRSRLGSAIAALAATDATDDPQRAVRFAEAETLLRESTDALLSSDASAGYAEDSIERLARLYEARGATDEASRWRDKLAAFKRLPSLSVEAKNLINTGKGAPAEAMFRELLRLDSGILESKPGYTGVAKYGLAVALRQQNRFPEAEVACQEAMEFVTMRFGPESQGVADCLNVLGRVKFGQKKYADGETCYRRELAIRIKLHGDSHPSVALALLNLCASLRFQGKEKLEEAESCARQAVEIRKKINGPVHLEVAKALIDLVMILQDGEKFSGAGPIHREILAIRRKLLPAGDPAIVESMKAFGNLLQKHGSPEEVSLLRRECLEWAGLPVSADPPQREKHAMDLADMLHQLDEFAAAEQLYRKALASRQKRLPPGDSGILTATASLGRCLSDWAWFDRVIAARDESARQAAVARALEAEQLLRECLAVRERGRPVWRTDDVRGRLGGALVAVAVTAHPQGAAEREAKFAEAEGLLLAAHKALMTGDGPGARHRRYLLTLFVRLYEAMENPGQVAQWREKLDRFQDSENDGAAESRQATGQ